MLFLLLEVCPGSVLFCGERWGAKADSHLASPLDPLIDDVPAIVSAFKECGKGGKIVLSKDTTYAVNSLLQMEGCDQCVVEVSHARVAGNRPLQLTFEAPPTLCSLVGRNPQPVRQHQSDL